jgi:hypothetical protein
VRFAKDPENLDVALCLDDTIVWGALSQMADAEDSLLREFSTRLRDRKLFKCIDIRGRVSHEFDPESKGVPEQLAKIDTCCAKINARLTEVANDALSSTPRILLDEAKRSPYNDAVGSTGPTERINVRTDGGALVDLKQRSRIVANLPDFTLFRAYHDRSDAESAQLIARTIDQEVAACR